MAKPTRERCTGKGVKGRCWRAPGHPGICIGVEATARAADRHAAVRPGEDDGAGTRCGAVNDDGYDCELPANHTGEHRAVIGAVDEQGPIPEVRWGRPDAYCLTRPDGECVSPVECMHGPPLRMSAARLHAIRLAVSEGVTGGRFGETALRELLAEVDRLRAALSPEQRGDRDG
jgi:hypothetical protein